MASSSPSTSSISPLFSSPPTDLHFNSNPKSMEQVWQDITFSSLQQPAPSRFIFQDSLPVAALRSAVYGATPPPPHPAVLCLNYSGPTKFQMSNVSPSVVNGSDAFNGFALPWKMRAAESDDRHHKRMIKNRESAARSRARKQAYTIELELEVAKLRRANTQLRRQQEQKCIEAAAAAQLPKKHAIYRTSTAPF